MLLLIISWELPEQRFTQSKVLRCSLRDVFIYIYRTKKAQPKRWCLLSCFVPLLMDRLGESDLDEMGLEVAAHSVALELHVGMVGIVNLFVPELRASTSLGVGAEVLRRIVKIRGALFVAVRGIERKGFTDVIHHVVGGFTDNPELLEDALVIVFVENDGFGSAHFWFFGCGLSVTLCHGLDYIK